LKKIFIFLYISVTILANQVYYVKNVKLNNLTQMSNRIVLEEIGVKNHQIDESQINNIIKKLYKYGYFRSIKVYYEDKDLIFYFTEKPIIANIQMNGYKTRDDDLKEIYERIGLRKGSIYTKEKLENARKKLLEQLRLEGYNNSVVEYEIKYINKDSVAIKIDVNKGDEILIKHIKLIGAKKLHLEDFEDSIANKEEDLISWWFTNYDGVMQLDQLEYDHYRIKDIYLQHGFLDARVSKAFSKIDFNTNSAEITYNIYEGPQYRVNNIFIQTDKENIIDSKKIISKLKLKKNKIFNIKKLRKDIDYIKIQVADKGYAYAKVTFDIKKYKTKNNADIFIKVRCGKKVYINDVIISKNYRTLDRVIRRNIYLAPKDLYNETDFKDSIRKLRRTGFFEDVKIIKKRVSDNLMDLIVEVKEAPTGSLVLGGGYSSYDGFMLNASIRDKNIFGSGKELSFSVDYSKKNINTEIKLYNPAINDSIYDGSISIYKKRTIITSDKESGDKTTKKFGFSLGIGREVGRYTRVGTIYAYDMEKTFYEKNSTLNNKFITSSIKPYIYFNDTDDFYIPRSGIIAGSSYFYAGLGGDAKYSISSNYFKYFYGLEDLIDYDLIFRYKTSLKMMFDNGNIPDGTTFYLGGPGSVRGYQYYAIQPDKTNHPFMRYWSNTVELSFPLIPKAKMRWSLFYDHGMIGYKKFNNFKKSGYGISIDWYSPIGPLQFIFARAISPEENDKTSSFEFSLGTAF